MIVTIAGGVGAARMLRALRQIIPDDQLLAIVNVGDDLVLHGLHISPDLDTVTYTLAEAIDPEKGWGLVGESWNAMETVGRYGGVTWFGLGDRDIGTHLFRTQRISEGATLSEITSEISAAWNLGLTMTPVTNDKLRTMVTLATDDPAASTFPALSAGSEISFQEYFVQRHHSVPVFSVRFDNAENAQPAPGVLDAIANADCIVIAPSNPIVSIAPVLAVPGIRDALVRRRSNVVAVSPIIAGSALKGPADRMMSELGYEPSALGVAKLSQDFVGTFVIDTADAASAPAIEALGMRCIVTDTIMSSPEVSAALASTVISSQENV